MVIQLPLAEPKTCGAAWKNGGTRPLLQPRSPPGLQPLHKGTHQNTPQKTHPEPAFSGVTLFPPALTTDTDSEEEEEEEGSLRDEWPAQPPAVPKPQPPGLYSVGVARKGGRVASGPKAAPRSAAAGRPLKPKAAAATAAAGRKQPFCLLLREAEAGSSFSDSSEDSFDQGY